MSAKKKPADEPEEPSRTAGACVLVVLVAVAVAVVFRLSAAVGILSLWLVGALALWRAARRHMSDSSATPPPQEWHPSCSKCAGQEPLDAAPSEPQKGMLIYRFALPKRPGHTHLHVVEEVSES